MMTKRRRKRTKTWSVYTFFIHYFNNFIYLNLCKIDAFTYIGSTFVHLYKKYIHYIVAEIYGKEIHLF